MLQALQWRTEGTARASTASSTPRGVGAELVEGPVAVDTLPEVDLGDGLEAEPAVDVDQQADLDAVTISQHEVVQDGTAHGASPESG